MRQNGLWAGGRTVRLMHVNTSERAAHTLVAVGHAAVAVAAGAFHAGRLAGEAFGHIEGERP